MAFTAEQVIARYISLRDEKEVIAERHKTELAPFHESLEKIEAWLQAKLTELGADNIKTEAGTAYRSTLTTAKVIDWEKVLEWIIDTEQWEFLVRNVNKTAVQDFATKYGQAPLGIEMGAVHKVNVRRG